MLSDKTLPQINRDFYDALREIVPNMPALEDAHVVSMQLRVAVDEVPSMHLEQNVIWDLKPVFKDMIAERLTKTTVFRVVPADTELTAEYAHAGWQYGYKATGADQLTWRNDSGPYNGLHPVASRELFYKTKELK